jgi:hypothetical protein
MQNNKSLNIKEYQYDRTINWLLETNRNNSYFPSIIPLKRSSSSSLSLLEQQYLQLKQQRKRKEILHNNDSNSSLSTTVIFERNQQVLSKKICNTVDKHQNRSLLSQLPISSNKHQKKLSFISSSFFFLITRYIFSMFLKSFFLFNVYSQ